MGFGYNPRLVRKFDPLVPTMERLDILEYFSVMRGLRQTFVREFTLWDAAGYNIVGKVSPKTIKKLGKTPKAEDILQALIEEQDKPKRNEIAANCNARSKYLQQAIEVSCLRSDSTLVNYIDSREVWRTKRKFLEALETALGGIRQLEIDNPELVSQILPKNANPANSLYLPLEVAEAIYLETELMISGKYGPETEEFFDEAILKVQEERGIPYTSIRSKKGPRKPGYLEDSNVIWTTSGTEFITEVLNRDPAYSAFVDNYTSLLRRTGETIVDCIRRLQQELDGGQK